MTKSNIGSAIARVLFEQGAVRIAQERAFILAAGWASPIYVDCRVLIGNSAARRTVTDCAVEMVKSCFAANEIEVIAGAETAGIPFAAWLAQALDLPLAYVRKRPLGIGRNAQVEGADVKDRRVLLFDDLTTDGSSKVSFTRGLRTAGADVRDAMSIFYNGLFPGAAERLRNEYLTLHFMASWEDILGLEHGRGLSPADRAMLEEFRNDPIAWSTRRGGRGMLRPMASAAKVSPMKS
jgi:orotate phosphoribosyltransferase